jgi:soluble lytic murein transglycosylase-like protein
VDMFVHASSRAGSRRVCLLGMKFAFKLSFVLVLLVMAGVSAFGAEVAVLRNGATIRHERREVIDQMARLYLSDAPDNYVDIPRDQIVRFEPAEEPLAPPPQAQPETQTQAQISAPIRPANIGDMVSAASSRNRVDPDLVISVIHAESNFDPRAISPKGAQGLMQLMPKTAASLGVANPMDPAANVEGGTRYLSELLALYNNDIIKALAAYNAGPERVDQYHGLPPYRETINYVSRIVRDFNSLKLNSPQLQDTDPGKRMAQLYSKTATPKTSSPRFSSHHSVYGRPRSSKW